MIALSIAAIVVTKLVLPPLKNALPQPVRLQQQFDSSLRSAPRLPTSIPTRDLSQPGMHVNVLFAFVALGSDQTRNEFVRRNVMWLKEQQAHTKFATLQCMIFVYIPFAKYPSWLHAAQQSPVPCAVMPAFGANFIQNLKHLHPFFLRGMGVDYVHVVMEDVLMYPPQAKLSLESYFLQIRSMRLSVASPAIAGHTVHAALQAWHKFGQRRSNGYLIEQGGLEIQATTYRLDAWTCLYDLIDTEFPGGWGLDIWYHGYCVQSGRVSGRIAVFQNQHVFHVALQSTNNNPKNGDWPGDLANKQEAAWRRYRNVTLTHSFPLPGESF